MKALFAALRFLTILPVPEGWTGDEKDLGQSVVYFPFIGLLIGVAVMGLALALGHVFPAMVVSVLLVIAMMAISGGLHLDGLADTMDGVLSARPRERILEIMQDSRTGPMGVAAVVCVILLKVAALAALPEGLRWRIVILMPLAGRCALMVIMNTSQYVRGDHGLGTLFVKDRVHLRAGLVLGVILLALLGRAAAGTTGLWAAAAAVAAALAFSAYTRRRIGGYTGDTLGAGCEIVELIPALVAAGFFHWGVGS